MHLAIINILSIGRSNKYLVDDESLECVLRAAPFAAVGLSSLEASVALQQQLGCSMSAAFGTTILLHLTNAIKATLMTELCEGVLGGGEERRIKCGLWTSPCLTIQRTTNFSYPKPPLICIPSASHVYNVSVWEFLVNSISAIK